MKKNKLFGLILVAILVIIGTIFVFYQKPQEARVVKAGYLPIITSLPVFVSQEYNYFENEGIKMDFIQLQSSNQEIEALIRGDLDVVVISSAIPAFLAENIDPGKFLIFAVSEPPISNQPFDSIIVKKESPLTSLKDLEGKKIGVFPGSTATNLLKKFLITKEVVIEKTNLMPITPPNQLFALETGSIDALHSYEPITTIAIKTMNARRIYPSVYAEQLNNNQGVALISKKFIDENPKLALKSVTILNKAFDFTRQNETVARSLLLKYMKLSNEISNEVVLANMLRYDEIDLKAMQQYIDRLYDLGELDKKLNFSDMIYNPR